MTSTTQQSRYRVEGMDCASCATKIDTAVRRLQGVEDVSVSVTAGTMTVRHQGDDTLAPAIAKRVTGLGYKIIPLPQSSAPAAKEDENHACGCGHDHHDHQAQSHDHKDHDHDHAHDDHDHGTESQDRKSTRLNSSHI